MPRDPVCGVVLGEETSRYKCPNSTKTYSPHHLHRCGLHNRKLFELEKLIRQALQG